MLAMLEKAGILFTTYALPSFKYSLAVYYIVMPAESSTNLARFDGVRYGLHISGDSGIDDYFTKRAARFG